MASPPAEGAIQIGDTPANAEDGNLVTKEAEATEQATAELRDISIPDDTVTEPSFIVPVNLETAEVPDGSAADVVATSGPDTQAVSVAEPVTREATNGSLPELRPALVPAAPAISPLIGSVDRLDSGGVSGWAWDPETPDRSVDVEVLDNDTVIVRVTADRFRPDVQRAGIGTGAYGFSIANLVGILPFSRHRVRVRRASDGRDLQGSPQWIVRPWPDSEATKFISAVIGSSIDLAKKPDDLAPSLILLLEWLNTVINAHETLTLAAKSDGGFGDRRALIAEADIGARTQELVSSLISAYEPLHFELEGPPLVSVIIPVYNKFTYTYNCLKSLQDALPNRPFEIIIADDCSTDETLLCSLVFTGAVRIVRNEKNQGFVRTCNAGAATALGQYLLFLNNDTLVKAGWLDELVETFERVPNVGIVGSKLLFEDGTLQEVGGIIWRLGDGWNWGRGRDPAEPSFMFLRDADWVSGAALMIERKMFEELNGFDELYVPAYYEDTDIAFRVRARGKRVVVQPASEIVHLEGISAGTDTAGTGMKRFQVINHAKFYQRWRGTLIAHRLNGEQPELEAERLVHKRAYFIDDTVPTPDQDAGSNAAVEHMWALTNLGYKVTFLPADNMARIDPYTGRLQKLGIECQYYPYFWSVEEVFRKALVKPDLVYLHRYTNASKYATMVRRYFPNCRIVYSVADLHFLRMERQLVIAPDQTSAAEVMTQRRTELSAMDNVDCVIVHSPVEAKMLSSTNPVLNVKVVPWTVLPRPNPLSFAERSGMAFIGGFAHTPNADAVQYLVTDILPLLHERAPDMTTYIIGSNMPDSIAGLRRPGLIPVGFVPELADVLHKLRCTVVPLRYGAGIKGKVLESFAHGLPCIMSEVAAEGLELPDDLAWLVARSQREFVEKLARTHEDEALNQSLSEAGLAYIEQRYSANAVKEALLAAVAG